MDEGGGSWEGWMNASCCSTTNIRIYQDLAKTKGGGGRREEGGGTVVLLGTSCVLDLGLGQLGRRIVSRRILSR